MYGYVNMPVVEMEPRALYGPIYEQMGQSQGQISRPSLCSLSLSYGDLIRSCSTSGWIDL